MYMTSDWVAHKDAEARTLASREADRKLIAKHTEEFLARGGEVTVINGYTAPVKAKTGYNRQSTLRGGRVSSAKKHFK